MSKRNNRRNNNNNRGQGNKPNTRKDDRSQATNAPTNDRDLSDYKGKLYNDPAWRKLGTVISDQANSYPLDYIAGTQFEVDPIYPKSNATTKGFISPHDVVTVLINPSFGLSKTRNSAINQAAFKMYTQLSSNNNKTTIYQPNDLALILGALGDIISLATYIRRAIGIAGTVSATNYAYPKAVITAMGINYKDLIANLANYRTTYNIIANLASSITFPKDLNYFTTCESLYKDVFLDHSTTRAQTYVTKPYSFWQYNDKKYESGGALISYSPWSASVLNLRSLLNLLSDMIEGLKGTALLNSVYSDVMKLYGGDMAKVVSLPLIPTDYAIAPVYSEEFMVGLENAVVYEGIGTKNRVDLYSDSSHTKYVGTAYNNVYSNANEGTIIYAPYVSASSVVSRWLSPTKCDVTPFVSANVNFHVDNPSVDDKLIAVRWMAPCIDKVTTYVGEGVTTPANDPIYQFAFSDHYICGMLYFSSASETGSTGIDDARMLEDYEGEMAIYAHPRRIVVGELTDINADMHDFDVKPLYMFAEIDVLTHVQEATLRNINETVMLALFNY